jgi:hypothetical protein
MMKVVRKRTNRRKKNKSRLLYQYRASQIIMHLWWISKWVEGMMRSVLFRSRLKLRSIRLEEVV